MMFRRISFAFCLFVLLSGATTAALSTEALSVVTPRKPLLMVAMGDSITAGTFSDVPIPQIPDVERQVREWSDDAIESEILWENKVFLSWASGLNVESHFVRLKRHLKQKGEKRPLRVLNISWPGDETSDLIDQAKQTIKKMASGKYAAIPYVTILIGSNDACSGEPVEEMRANLLETFRLLASIQQRERIRVLLVGIPRIPDLGVRYVRERKTLFGISCERVRNKILKLCNSLLLWDTPEEYDQKMRIVEDRNILLRNVAREASVLYPSLDVVYSNRLYNLEIPPEILSVDCFHPAKEGQRRIAEELWLDQPWFH